MIIRDITKRIGSILMVLLLTAMLFYHCKVEISEEVDEYSLEIYRWFSQDYGKLQETGGTWFLYFDDRLTCSTCKLDILSQARREPNLWLITRFDTDAKLLPFKRSYKLENRILNIKPDPNHRLSNPFLFQMDEKTIKDLTILNEDVLAKNDWKEFFHTTQ